MNATEFKSPEGANAGPGLTSLEDKEAVLARHSFLKGLNPHQRRLLIDCALVTTFEAGDILFREGDPADRFFLILSGKVALQSYVCGQEQALVQIIVPDDVLGWSWLFPPYFWHFGARALETTKIAIIRSAPFRAEFEADHEFGYEMIQRMAAIMLDRLQATRRRLLELSIPQSTAGSCCASKVESGGVETYPPQKRISFLQ